LYTIALSRAFTGRKLVMKVGGGWHGAQPWGLKGTKFHPRSGDGFQQVETEGFPSALTDEVLITRFNDPEMLREHLSKYGDRLACFIVEPFIGAGGLIPATREYLQSARELTQQYGALLIFDEVIAGFRFRAGDAGSLYGLQPDLATFGKIIGGGMPLTAVAGRADIMGLTGPDGDYRVKFSGGTYSAHPASLLAAKTLITYLVENEDKVYPRLAELGAKTRHTMEAAFAQEGIYAPCTGHGNEVLSGSSLAFVHFPYKEDAQFNRPEDVFDPSLCDTTLSEKVLVLALLMEDVHVVHGHGALCTAHAEADLELLGEACRRVARRIKPYL
jgi:glutamate-1-semialdehyde 2,1-aminomutase